jgi:phosphoribosyl 1,2-cyclic phosphate phosphodiesterase
MKVTLLGCGGSGGVPLPGRTTGGYWGACDPGNPKNRRLRVSILVETRGKAILIDTSPDLRAQLLDNAVATVDAVLFTHAHADHVHGLDDLRPLVYGRKRPIPAYMTGEVHETLTRRFDYAFTSSHANSELYPALLEDQAIAYGAFDIEGVPARAFRQDHGNIDSTGFRIGPLAYSTDVVDLDEAAFAALAGIELWIVDCLRFEPHPTHTHFARTLGWIERLRPRLAVLTHMNHTTDYETLRAQCPPGVEPGYDGMVIELPED